MLLKKYGLEKGDCKEVFAVGVGGGLMFKKRELDKGGRKNRGGSALWPSK